MFELLKTKFKSLNLRAQLIVSISALLLVLIVLLFTVFPIISRHFVSKSVENKGRNVGKGLAAGAAKCIREGGESGLQLLIMAMSEDDDIAYIEIVDGEGRRLASGGGGVRPGKFGDFDGKALKEPKLIEKDLKRYYVQAIKSRDGDTLGQIRMALSLERAESTRKKALWGIGLLLLVSVALVGYLTVYLFTKLVAGPVEELTRAIGSIADGNLTGRISVVAGGEFAVLAANFNKMTSHLEGMISNVREGHLKLKSGTDRIIEVADQVAEGSEMQDDAFGEMSSATEEMNQTIKNIAENVDELSTSSEETSSSILEMAATIEEVSEHTESLTNSVDETSSATEEMVFSIKEIDGNVEFLNNFITDTSASIEQMDVSIREVEKAASESNELSQTVAEKAEKGMDAVDRTMAGMEDIRDIVKNISDTITALGKRSQEIGKILNVIEDIAEQTNLLSLNAAIIAAQAGEEGKGFAVVADEIRQLAERTSTSTKDISELIGAVQKETAEAVKTMKQGNKSVDEGVDLSREAGSGLNEILTSAQRSSDKSRDIARATKGQAQSSKTIRSSIDQVKDMTEQIRKATSEQTRGSEVIMSSMDRMREMTNQVKRATIEQHQGSQLITEAIESITDKIGHIQKATAHQSEGSEVMLASLHRFRDIIDKNMKSSEDLRDAVKILNEQADILDAQIKQFKTQNV